MISLYTCPPYSTITFTVENPKTSVSTVLFIHTSNYLRYVTLVIVMVNIFYKAGLLAGNEMGVFFVKKWKMGGVSL